MTGATLLNSLEEDICSNMNVSSGSSSYAYFAIAFDSTINDNYYQFSAVFKKSSQ